MTSEGPWRHDDSTKAEAMALPTIPVGHKVTIRPPVAGDVRSCASIGPAGELVAVWTQIEQLPATMSWTRSAAGAKFPDAVSPRLVNARVTVHAPALRSVVSITGLGLANFTVQPLPDGNILLVGRRSYWRPEGADRNAVVYGADGSVLARDVLGDGIAHVLADSSGHIWVGYTDEGIYGNYGWGSRGGPEPIGWSGLIRWSPDLRSAWHHPSRDCLYGVINECSTLNVDGTTGWTCYDADYPIVTVEHGQLAGWSNQTRPVSALVVDGTRAGLLGAYRRLTVGELSSGRFHPTREYRIVLPNGAPLPSHAEIVTRGGTMHVITDDDWYQLSIRDIPA